MLIYAQNSLRNLSPTKDYFFFAWHWSSSNMPNTHFKCVETAAEIGQFKEFAPVTKLYNFYDLEKTKNSLLVTNLSNAWPHIYLCVGFIPDLMYCLYSNTMLEFIEVHAQKVNVGYALLLVGQLLDDVDANKNCFHQYLLILTIIKVDDLEIRRDYYKGKKEKNWEKRKKSG